MSASVMSRSSCVADTTMSVFSCDIRDISVPTLHGKADASVFADHLSYE